jgi:hypothetical protein
MHNKSLPPSSKALRKAARDFVMRELVMIGLFLRVQCLVLVNGWHTASVFCGIKRQISVE